MTYYNLENAKLVSVFHPLESETVKHLRNNGNISRNTSNLINMKALANRVLERNKPGNKSETQNVYHVSQPRLDETNKSDEIDFYVQLFEERAAIKQFDAGLSKEQSEKESLVEMIELCINKRLKNEHRN